MPREAPGFTRLLRDVERRLAAGEGSWSTATRASDGRRWCSRSILKAHGLVLDPVTELRRIYRSTAMQEPVQEAFVRGLSTR